MLCNMNPCDEIAMDLRNTVEIKTSKKHNPESMRSLMWNDARHVGWQTCSISLVERMIWKSVITSSGLSIKLWQPFHLVSLMHPQSEWSFGGKILQEEMLDLENWVSSFKKPFIRGTIMRSLKHPSERVVLLLNISSWRILHWFAVTPWPNFIELLSRRICLAWHFLSW